LQLCNVKFRYPGKQHQAPAAAWQLDIPAFSMAKGEHVFLRGSSGSGKSTLLNLVAGIHQAAEGKVSVLGQDLDTLSGAKRDRFRAAHLGFVFQQLNLIPYLSVQDNILLAQHFSTRKVNKKQALPLISHILAELKLPASILEQPAGSLSIGQQQRVAIARALVNQPELLIADEPTSALDSDNRDAFMQLLFRLANENDTSLLFVSHDLSLSAGFQRTVEMTSINLASRCQEFELC